MGPYNRRLHRWDPLFAVDAFIEQNAARSASHPTGGAPQEHLYQTWNLFGSRRYPKDDNLTELKKCSARRNFQYLQVAHIEHLKIKGVKHGLALSEGDYSLEHKELSPCTIFLSPFVAFENDCKWETVFNEVNRDRGLGVRQRILKSSH